MSKPSSATPENSAGDLLDRWLAHHEGEPSEPSAEATSAGAPAADTTNVAASAPAEPEPVPAATPTPAPPGSAHLGSAAGAPSSGLAEQRSAAGSAPADRPSPRPAAHAPAAAKAPTPVRRPPVAPTPSLTLQSPTRGTHRALTLLTPVAAVATAAVGWLAWSGRTTPLAVLAAGLAVLTLVLWSALRRRPDTVVTVERGTLRIEQGQHRHVFPLDQTYPPIDILGDPGDRAWKVLIHRRSMSPYVVTRAMVDPREFTELVRHYRPDA